MTNSILIVKFGNDTVINQEVTWDEDYIEEGEELADEIFANGPYDNYFSQGLHPDMTIYLKENKEINSRVVFEQECFVIHPTIPLSFFKRQDA